MFCFFLSLSLRTRGLDLLKKELSGGSIDRILPAGRSVDANLTARIEVKSGSKGNETHVTETCQKRQLDLIYLHAVNDLRVLRVCLVASPTGSLTPSLPEAKFRLPRCLPPVRAPHAGSVTVLSADSTTPLIPIHFK
jgi:hypothetical protein